MGSKGEILPSKSVRKRLGLRPGSLMELRAEGDELIVTTLPDPLKQLSGVLDVKLTLKELAKALTIDEAELVTKRLSSSIEVTPLSYFHAPNP